MHRNRIGSYIDGEINRDFTRGCWVFISTKYVISRYGCRNCNWHGFRYVFYEVISMFGKFFIENRYMSMPILLTLPVIGILERYGLKERAEALITKSKGATTGRVLMSYFTIREASAAVGLNIGGHAQTVRPLVAPMAEGAAHGRYGELPEKLKEKIKANAAAAENTAWFFGEDIFIATGAILLMKGFFDSVGMHVDVWDMALWGIPTAISAFCCELDSV